MHQAMIILIHLLCEYFMCLLIYCNKKKKKDKNLTGLISPRGVQGKTTALYVDCQTLFDFGHIYISFIKGDSNIIFARIPLCLHDRLLLGVWKYKWYFFISLYKSKNALHFHSICFLFIIPLFFSCTVLFLIFLWNSTGLYYIVFAYFTNSSILELKVLKEIKKEKSSKKCDFERAV